MAGINDYSNTAGSNTTINGIDISEGCSPAGINNAIRQLMADIADVDDGVVPLQTPDINGGTIDGAAISGSSTIDNSIIGGTTPAAGTFTTLTANTSITGTLNTAAQTNITSVGTLTGLTVDGNVSINGGTIKLDGNYPVATNNVALGNFALDDGSLSGNSNTAIGHATLSDNTTGGTNTAVGNQALTDNTTGGQNTAVGYNALRSNTTANNNTAVGREALEFNTTGSANTAVGYQSLEENTEGNSNVAVGTSALTSNTTGGSNVALGWASLSQNLTGNFNTAVGREALENNTASKNTAVGYQALTANTTGTQNVALGYNALDANTTASNNTAVGHQALTANTTGQYNVALGADALKDNTTASNNVAIGQDALFSNTTGSSMTAIGQGALDAHTTGNSTTAVGKDSLGKLTTGTDNTAIGAEAGSECVTGDANTFLGRSAGFNATGDSNTFVGRSSGSTITTGAKNTILGRYSGNQGGLDIRTSSNNIVLSDGDGNVRLYVNSSGQVLVGTTSTDDANQGIRFKTTGLINATATSDISLKLNRKTSDGAIAQFRKDNSVVGSIGTYAGDTYIGTTDTGLRFDDGASAYIPWNTSTNSATDGTINLGFSTVKYNNLYLGGNIYLGGTGSANALDDYETGTFTVSAIRLTGLTTNIGRYTKIGNLVNCEMHIEWTSSDGTGNDILFTGLPFTSASGTTDVAVGATIIYGTDINTDVGTSVALRIDDNQTRFYLMKTMDSSFSVVSSSQANSATVLRSSFTYMT